MIRCHKEKSFTVQLLDIDEGGPTQLIQQIIEIVTSSVRAKVDKDLVISLKVEGSLDLLVRGLVQFFPIRIVECNERSAHFIG